MFDLISRLREPLSAEGRAGFSQVMYLSCIVGLVRGFSLISFIPAAIALTSGQAAWGMSLRAWLVVLAVCALLSFILEYVLA
ncbi:MAG: ABC transporter ATP-binding protein, partial [Actinomyces sp.]|nr:ABC transporter ATP-binding protein [Actinomyces sp.]